jgi:flagellar motor switch/type III secretory pathway protein FliN
VFTEGSKWGEELFSYLFGEKDFKTDIYEDISIDSGYFVYDVILEDQSYKNGIVIYKKEAKTTGVKQSSGINLPVVLRIFHREIPLSEVEKIGETSEFLLDRGSSFKVELLLNGKVIGEGELLVDDGSYRLKISKIFS